MAQAPSPSSSEPPFMVMYTKKDERCAGCSRPILAGALVCRYKQGRNTCTGCEGLGDHLLLPSGDVALTRRATANSRVAHPVYAAEKRRNRFERRGTLVESRALQMAEAECEADAGKREVKRAKDAVRREEQDLIYRTKFALRVRQLYPSCPARLEVEIALHACEKHSGRVGRRETAREDLDDESIILAVRAHIRHTQTEYDELFLQGLKKEQARAMVIDLVNRVERQWRGR